MPDVLLELLSEEIPARMQERASADLVRLFAAELAKAGLAAAAIEPYVTPRRLALIARGLPDATAPVVAETKGPRADAAPQAIAGFLAKTGLSREQLVERADAKGNRVLFAAVETPGRATAAVLADLVPAIVRQLPWPKSMRWGAASASTESPRWVRPLQGLVLLFGDAVVPCAVAGIASGRETAGHRFLHAGPVTIATPDDYVGALRAAHVIACAEERRRIVRDGAGAAAAAAGLTLVADEGLVAENAGLTEWPVPLLGRFDPDYLSVPPEVIQLTARVNQKYFVCRDAAGALADAFVLTANIVAPDGGAAIVEGNRKVLAARLADARFFYDTDLKVPLAEQATKLDRVVFHEKLGTVADKAARVAKLARWLVEEGIVGAAPASAGTTDERARLADLAEQAGLLCKADLVTGMVGEFPELQGVMGGYYAAAQGLDPQVGAAIRDHYKPVGQSDAVPTAPVTVAVALADKLDTLFSFYAAEMPATGSKDPFALRRAGLSVLSLLVDNQIRLPIIRLYAVQVSQLIWTRYDMLQRAYSAEARNKARNQSIVAISAIEVEQQVKPGCYGEIAPSIGDIPELVSRLQRQISEIKPFIWKVEIDRTAASALRGSADLLVFLADRLKVQQREAGVRHDLIDAVFALGGEDDLVRLLARVHALQAFVETADGADLLAGYRRAANILRAEAKKDAAAPARHPGEGRSPGPGASASVALDPGLRRDDEGGEVAFPYSPEPAEAALAEALDATLPAVAAAVADERFADAMSTLSSLKSPIDAFFDGVTVNSPDEAVRMTRLSLLARLVAAFHTVADFSRIEG